MFGLYNTICLVYTALKLKKVPPKPKGKQHTWSLNTQQSKTRVNIMKNAQVDFFPNHMVA